MAPSGESGVRSGQTLERVKRPGSGVYGLDHGCVYDIGLDQSGCQGSAQVRSAMRVRCQRGGGPAPSVSVEREELSMRAKRDAEFAAYVDGRLPAFRRMAYLLCHDWHQADDLVQISLAKLYTSWSRFREVGNADAYARKVILRSFLDERRRFWRREVPTEFLPDQPVDSPGVVDRL